MVSRSCRGTYRNCSFFFGDVINDREKWNDDLDVSDLEVAYMKSNICRYRACSTDQDGVTYLSHTELNWQRKLIHTR